MTAVVNLDGPTLRLSTIVRSRRKSRMFSALTNGFGLVGEILVPRTMPSTVTPEQLIGPWLADARARNTDFKPAYITLAWISAAFAALVVFLGTQIHNWSVVDGKVVAFGVISMLIFALGVATGLVASYHKITHKLWPTFTVTTLLIVGILASLSTVGVMAYNFSMYSVL